jgi:hypothetical protein
MPDRPGESAVCGQALEVGYLPVIAIVHLQFVYPNAVVWHLRGLLESTVKPPIALPVVPAHFDT